ncbi:girdin-like [Acipenser oxyrinchus oxyrinchus]|uniref:Girdin-like n=1 Tax=Acipenser oxyrinchus oxyrinchus TaxID=40147 RepID=A0AAD8CFC0_ACIOX|nr:girdin-like [Acipenser oxyrinchus oxyrinchus]
MFEVEMEDRFVEVLEEFLASALVAWVKTFEPLVEGGDELSAPYLEVNSGSHDALRQYLRLLDGVFLNRVLRLIDPNPKAERVYRNERSDEVLRVQNLSILTRHLRQYYQVCESESVSESVSVSL